VQTLAEYLGEPVFECKCRMTICSFLQKMAANDSKAQRNGLRDRWIARLVRMTGGNMRLLARLLTQVERVLGVNDTQVMSVEIIEAARDSLVIGQA
jgi:pyrroloquinoline quinone (PQQ) biosynthesis protein C